MAQYPIPKSRAGILLHTAQTSVFGSFTKTIIIDGRRLFAEAILLGGILFILKFFVYNFYTFRQALAHINERVGCDFLCPVWAK